MSRSCRRIVLVAAPLLLLPFLAANGPRFHPDDPIWVDPDRMSIPKPKEIELAKGYDLLENTFFHPGGGPGRAQNVNTLGEVPDSSWFTNRIGLRPMSIDDLVRGPNRRDGPDLSKGLMVSALKTQGITPGFTAKDARGDTYIVKVDPLDHPQITTSAEVIGTKFFHAFGYHVPENYLAFVRPDELKVAPEAKFTDRTGIKRLLTPGDVEEILKRVPVRPDGTIQIMASLRIKGEPVGRFKYYGTRSDDPNDVFPHEDRRELRGMRVFAAWLNHNDSDAANTLDMYVTEDGRKYVKHYLIDFGTVLGSGAHEPKALRAGNEYYIEWTPILRSALTLGWWDRPWRTLEYPDFASIGRFEAEYFRPEAWKADYPNQAHERMSPEDAFWAARAVLRFDDARVRAIVATGKLSDPAAENYLIDTLVRRRDKIVRHYLQALAPLDAFRISGGDLAFDNLGMQAGLAPSSTYRYQWFRFDNATRLELLGERRSVSTAAIPVPRDAAPLLMVRIETDAPSMPAWNKKIDVYLRNGSTRSVVGIERGE